MTELPRGWRRVSLADLGTWHGGGTPSKARSDYWSDGTVPWLSPKDMGPEVIRSTQDQITEAAVGGSTVRRVPAGSVALVVRSGILERTIPIAVVPMEVTLNQDMKALVPGPDVDARWVAWGLRSREQTLLRQCRKAGTTVASIETKRLLAQALPVPPLDEQRHIVEILEDHLSRLDAASTILRSCQTRIEAWRRSCIDGIVWREREEGAVAVADLLAERMRNGHSARASTTGAGVRALTLTSVTRNSFNDQFTKIVTVAAERVRDLWLHDGDILVQRSNTPELVGTTAIYHGPIDWAIFPDLLIRLRADESRVSPDYLATVMRTERAHRRLRAQAKGLAGSMPKIDQAAVGSVLVPLPPSAAQDEVVTRVAEIEEEHSRLVSDIQVADGRVQSLRRALLAAAFSGQLTR